MKTLSKLKLNQFSKDELDQRALNALKGGCSCTTVCSCSGACSKDDTTLSFLNYALSNYNYNTLY